MESNEHLSILRQHKSFVEYVKLQIFEDLFNEIDKEAEATEKHYDALYHGNEDVVSRSEVYDEIKERRETLNRIKLHITLAMLTSLYHQWEKDIKKWMGSDVKILPLLNKFKQSKWNLGECDVIDECRLIVNSYKHNESEIGVLDKEYPKFFKKEVINSFNDEEFGWKVWEYEDLSMKEGGFCEIAGAFKQFWEKFPGEYLQNL